MKVTIDQAIPQVTFPAPGQRKVMYEIHYTTGKGIKGSVVLEQSKSSQPEIMAAIKADIEHLEQLVGTTTETK